MVTYGERQQDGARRVYFDGVESGKLMPQLSAKVRAASPDIRPVHYGEVLYDGGDTVIDFSAHYSKIRGLT
jgi:hypothetical protein